jgi:hypothetical protein
MTKRLTLPATKRPPKTAWKPGQTGNPTGKNKPGPKPLPYDVRKALADALPKAIATLVELMNHSRDDRVRLAAANSLVDRNLGKPAVVMIDGTDGKPIVIHWLGENPAEGSKTIEHRSSEYWPADAPEAK